MKEYEEFEYKVTVIVPVYNVENYLEECLDSIVHQTINKSEIEVLLVDDGSTDTSLDICRMYSELYPFFYVASKENGGVSSARNLGIKLAKGKYLMYLDSDDTIGPETLKSVTDFFEQHFYEVDLVTYTEYTTINGVKQPQHFRYNYFVESGVYDLNKCPFSVQTRLSICVKNKKNSNLLFDESMGYHEDQKYISQILEEKLKIGFCKEAIYFWKRNSNGIMAINSNSIDVFEIATKLWEDIFDKYDVVPQYFQAMFVHDVNWKIRSNMFFPYHYEKIDFDRAMKRITKLFQKVEANTIINHPGVDKFHVYYFLRWKNEPLVSIIDKDKISIYNRKDCIYQNDKVEIIINTIKIINNTIKIDGFLKSPVFDFLEKPVLNMVILDAQGLKREIEMDLFDSAGGYYKSKTKTNLFWGFVQEISIPAQGSFGFEVIIDGIKFNVCYYFMKYCNIGKKNPFIITKKRIIKFKQNKFYIETINKEDYKENISKLLNCSFTSALFSYYDKEVWLYYDCINVEKDNGYYQFCHDIKKNDGVLRYYICANDINQYKYLYTEFKDFVVSFGSLKHKLIYLAADKVITAYIEEKNMNPFNNNEFENIKSFVNHQIVYLQHGILHAHLPWKYAPGRIIADRIIVSSDLELYGFQNIYHFPRYMLIPSGMPRFEKLNKKIVPSGKILFAPSWRNYLIGNASGNQWILTKEKFLSSNYFKNINDFLNDIKLEKILEQYNITLEFKIHPIFIPYLHLFNNNNKRVIFVTHNIIEEEYKLVITDFSSFIFDFVYLNRPIIYYVPDYKEFRAGLNQYWELDLPFEKAFGNLVLKENELIQEIRRICERNYKPDELYKKRMDTFFLPINDCCQKIYDEIA